MSKINNFDLSAIQNFVADLKKSGISADYDISEINSGVVKIISDNWIKKDGSKVLFEIHKLTKQLLVFFKKNKVDYSVVLLHSGG